MPRSMAQVCLPIGYRVTVQGRRDQLSAGEQGASRSR